MGTLDISSEHFEKQMIMSKNKKNKALIKRQEPSASKSISFWNDAWSGEQIRKLGFESIADFLTDKDKVCTDKKDDGNISNIEKIKAVAKGLFFGIPKAVINHPLSTTIAIAISAGVMTLTGGAALPLLVCTGILAGGVQVASGVYNAAKATNDGDAKAAWEGIGTGTAIIGLSALTVKCANKTAAKGGVKSLQGLEKESWGTNFKAMFKAIPDAVKQSGLNIKGNYLTWKTGVIHANSNTTRSGVETAFQAGNKVQDAYKIDLNGTVEEVLAKNPGLKYDATQGKYYVKTYWGENMYIQNENYMYVKFGEIVDPKSGKYTINHNVVDGKEFYDTYIDHAKLEIDGTKKYINPETLKPGQHITASKNAPARFKIVPEGTKYMSAEGEGTVQPKSVLRIDEQGRPYQSTIEYMLRNVRLTDQQIKLLSLAR